MRTVWGILIIFTSLGSQNNFRSKIVPPGTIAINDSLFIDKVEVANISWREYIFYLLDVKKDVLAYDNALPDTTVWLPDADAVSQYYFRHPGFNNYPVVGISYEQAIDFCKWRTYAANQGIYFKEHKIKNPKEHLQDKFPIRFYYRLPTKEEWEKIAAGKYSLNEHPYGYPGIYMKWKRKDVKAFNCNYSSVEIKLDSTKAFYTSDVKSYFKNSSGVYTMIGNVAEMISEKGIAKGGSFVHAVDSSRVTDNQFYTKAERWLGFRCVAVLVK